MCVGWTCYFLFTYHFGLISFFCGPQKLVGSTHKYNTVNLHCQNFMCSKDFSMMTLVKKLTINSCLFISCVFYFFYFRGKRQQLSCLPGGSSYNCKILDFHTDTTSSSSSSCNCQISPPLFVCLFVVKSFHPPVDQAVMESEDINKNSDCLLYPTNVVSCFWSLDHLQATQVVPHVRYFLMTVYLKATALVSIS